MSSSAENSALHVAKGVAQPEQVNSDYINKHKKLFSLHRSAEEYFQGLLSQNRTLLSQAITLVESKKADHQELAQQIIAKCLPYAGNSIRIGITGVPGVGKSTLIDVFGSFLTQHGHKVAVLAIDPSSERSKGSILGDKTRMEELANNENAFIRPSPSAGSLGGVARKTRESILLCETAGFDIIIVETVGVGQSEIAAHSMVDFFLLLQLSNAGDELQGIKRGIMEMADMIAINKSEGANRSKAELAASQYRNALHLFPPKKSQWIPPVILCSAYTKEGLETLWENISNYVELTKRNGYFQANRDAQNIRILKETVEEKLLELFYGDEKIAHAYNLFKENVHQHRISAYIAAQDLIELYVRESKS